MTGPDPRPPAAGLLLERRFFVEPCVKVLGADFELANALDLPHSKKGSAGKAARRLLDEIRGYPRRANWGDTPLEWGRRFLPSCGASAYIDSDHLEINLPEHTRAEDHPALVHAGLRIAREAQVAASRKLEGGGRVNVMAAVSDGQQSWGHHLNLMVRRRLFDDLFGRKPHLAAFIATHLATATLYTGQGKVGAGNNRPACAYQLSQRADWFEELVGEQTTHCRPLLNCRDEPHAGDGLARLHLIFFDRVLCPIANYLMAGATQLVLAMAEAGCVDVGLLLDDPLEAAHAVSRDLSLKQPLPLAQRGRNWTAVEVQKGLADLAGEFVADGRAGASVPGAEAIVACWQETLDLLARRDLTALARRCDWVLKYLLLDRQRGRKGLTWASPELKVLDLRYASLDPDEGMFWMMAAAGHVEAMPAPERVERFVCEPPDDTRAYLRAHVLRRFGEHVADMDWAWIRFRMQADRYWWAESELVLPDPTAFGRAEAEPLLGRCSSLAELIAAVGAATPARDPQPAGRLGGWARRRNGSVSPWHSGPYWG
jgi:Pup amidohydrolase